MSNDNGMGAYDRSGGMYPPSGMYPEMPYGYRNPQIKWVPSSYNGPDSDQQTAPSPSKSHTLPTLLQAERTHRRPVQLALRGAAGEEIVCHGKTAVLRWDNVIQALRAEVDGRCISLTEFEKISGSSSRNPNKAIRLKLSGLTLQSAAQHLERSKGSSLP